MGTNGTKRLVLLCLACCLALSAATLLARRADKEGDLVARLEHETDPVKRAKLEIRLAHVKLVQATETFDQGNIAGSRELLGAFLERVHSAWSTLQKSGRPAHKKPQGFKELDIELREDVRYLEDLKHRFPYAEREPVEKVAHEVDDLRNEVLKALFPPLPPKRK